MKVPIPLSQLTDRQLLMFIAHRLESNMADLNQSVDDLTAAVDSMGLRFNDTIAPLQQALADAQQAVSDLTVENEADKQALTDALSSAQSAADEIESQVGELNAIGTPPTDEPPAEPPADEPPAEPTPA